MLVLSKSPIYGSNTINIWNIWHLFLSLSQGQVLELATSKAVVVGQLHEVASGIGAS